MNARIRLVVATLAISTAALAQPEDAVAPAEAAASEPSQATPTPNAPTETTPSAALNLKENLMYLRYGVAEGFAGISAFQNGRRLEPGFFGGNIDAVFGEFPDALAAAQRMRSQRIWGVTLYAVGLTILVADLVFILVSLERLGASAIESRAVVFYSALGVGGVVGIIGGLLIGQSYSAFVEAVNRYNFGLLNQQLPPDQRIDVDRFLSQRAPPSTSLLQLTF